MEKKLGGNYTRMLRVVLKKSLTQHHTKQQLYGYLPPITKTIQIRQTRHVGHCWRSRDKLISYVLSWTSSHGQGKLKTIYRISVPIRDVTLKTYRERLTIETSGERGPRKSMLVAWHDDDDNVCKCNNYFDTEVVLNFANTYGTLALTKNVLTDGLSSGLWILCSEIRE